MVGVRHENESFVGWKIATNTLAPGEKQDSEFEKNLDVE